MMSKNPGIYFRAHATIYISGQIRSRARGLNWSLSPHLVVTNTQPDGIYITKLYDYEEK